MAIAAVTAQTSGVSQWYPLTKLLPRKGRAAK
jgi:hypothetical protein